MGIAADHYRLTPGFAGLLGGGGGWGPVINYREVGVQNGIRNFYGGRSKDWRGF